MKGTLKYWEFWWNSIATWGEKFTHILLASFTLLFWSITLYELASQQFVSAVATLISSLILLEGILLGSQKQVQKIRHFVREVGALPPVDDLGEAVLFQHEIDRIMRRQAEARERAYQIADGLRSARIQAGQRLTEVIHETDRFASRPLNFSGQLAAYRSRVAEARKHLDEAERALEEAEKAKKMVEICYFELMQLFTWKKLPYPFFVHEDFKKYLEETTEAQTEASAQS